MAFEKFKKFAEKFKNPEAEKLKAIREEERRKAFAEAYRKGYAKGLRKEAYKQGLEHAKSGRKGGIWSNPILNALGESAQLEFGGKKKGKGGSYLEDLIMKDVGGFGGSRSGGFGLGALEAEGILHRKTIVRHKKHKRR